MHLITGHVTPGHITSADDGLIWAQMFGGQRTAVQPVSAVLESANSVVVKGGLIRFDGRFATIAAEGEAVQLNNGEQGLRRRTFVGVRYVKGDDSKESMELVAIDGPSSEGEPLDPDVNHGYDSDASILNGASEAFWPLFSIDFNGLVASDPVSVHGTPAGDVVFRKDNLSPAAIYGGVWERLDSGLFLGLRIYHRLDEGAVA